MLPKQQFYGEIIVTKEILIVAGETSADQHGAALVSQLKAASKDVTFFGIGGDNLRWEGVQLVEHAENMAIMGFVEVAKHYWFLRTVYNKVVSECEKRNPARAILIDYPGFNLRLAKELKKRQIPVTYYISPQLWAWKEKRIEIIRECVDQMLCIFPFEEQWYRQRGVEATYVGHPFLDGEPNFMEREYFLDKHSLSTNTIVLALMPGSRQQEVNRHLKTMIKTVELVKRDIEISAIVGKAPAVELPQEIGDKIHIETDTPEMVLKYASIGIVSSGTVSLQSAIYGVPSVVIYKMNPLTWIVANKVTQVSYASMTNLIAKEQVLPELLQSRARPEKIADCLKKWLRSEDLREQTVNQLSEVKRQLGGPGASQKVARLILERLEAA
ncbi:MAG: lipid-A-disaccharide synthase [Candidatus Marinimicrobia bacterium]|nr:lipid-A-disaccharide synthase [Candidatus Neomarinimicrobiota bacterium]